VVIGKKKNTTSVACVSKAPKKVSLIDLSDSKEVCDFNFKTPLFRISFISMLLCDKDMLCRTKLPKSALTLPLINPTWKKGVRKNTK
jgi:hypothetical protein